jgi:hypothetical protein
VNFDSSLEVKALKELPEGSRTGNQLNKIVNASLAFICQNRRERVAAFEHYLMDPSSQISGESDQQTRLIAVEPPGNW